MNLPLPTNGNGRTSLLKIASAVVSRDGALGLIAVMTVGSSLWSNHVSHQKQTEILQSILVQENIQTCLMEKKDPVYCAMQSATAHKSENGVLSAEAAALY